MQELFKAAVERGASDIHIKAGDFMRARIHGELQPLTQQKLTVDQVKAVTERSDLLVEISGRGRAVAQSPPAGTIVASDALVVVRFEPGADSI